MKDVLVDTSVWVDHFRQPNVVLADLLQLDLIMIHPLVIGEVACGTPPDRIRILSDLRRLKQTKQVSVHEIVDFIERERLFGLGCGFIDLLLLSTALITLGVELWTFDKRLSILAKRFGVMYQPPLH